MKRLNFLVHNGLHSPFISRIFLLLFSCALISSSPFSHNRSIPVSIDSSADKPASLDTNPPISFTINDGNILGLAISADGSKLAVSTQAVSPVSPGQRHNSQWLPGKIHVFSIETQQEIGQITPELPIYLLIEQYPYGENIIVLGVWENGGIAISNNNYLAAVSSDGTMQLWNMSTNQRVAWDGGTYNGDFNALFDAHYHELTNPRVSFSADDSVLGVVRNQLYRIYRTLDGQRMSLPSDNRGNIDAPMSRYTSIATSPLLNFMAGRTSDPTPNSTGWGPYGELRTLDWRQWDVIPFPGVQGPMAISPDGKYILNWVIKSPTYQVWTKPGYSSLFNISIPPTLNGQTLANNYFIASFSPTGDKIAIFSAYGVKVLYGYDEAYIRPSNKYLGNVSVLDITSKQKISDVTFPIFYPRATVFSRNGDIIAYVASENTVEVRKLEMN
jgi:WD40 repeat protein